MIISFVVISIVVGELLGKLCRGRGRNKFIRMGLSIAAITIMLAEEMNALDF